MPDQPGDRRSPSRKSRSRTAARKLGPDDEPLKEQDDTAGSQFDQPTFISDSDDLEHTQEMEPDFADADATIIGDSVSTVPSSSPGQVDNGSGSTDFGDYELLEEIARGGMGVVYKARHRKLKRICALKMILSGQLAGEAEVRRFHAEAEAAAQLDHVGIVSVYDVGQVDQQHYFSMAFVDGQSLQNVVRDGPVEARQAAQWMLQIGQAIAYAHQQHVVHRDLKPANVLLDQSGTPKVTDFGLAKQTTGQSDLTATGQILGTPNYMPPEQATGQIDQVDELADLYSLGGVLYCLLTGRPPFQAANPLDTLKQVVQAEPTPPSKLNVSCPRDLETICLKCLAKQRARRYATVQELCEELERFLNNEPILARPAGRVEKTIRWARNKPAVASSLGLLGILVIALLITGPLIAWQQSEIAQQKSTFAAQQVTLRQEADEARKRTQENLVQVRIRGQLSESVALRSRFPGLSLLLAHAVYEQHPESATLSTAASQNLIDAATSLGGTSLGSATDTHLAFASNSHWLITAGQEGVVRCIQHPQRNPAEQPTAQLVVQSPVTALSVKASGDRFAVGLENGAIRLGTLTTAGAQLGPVIGNLNGAPQLLEFLGDSRLLARNLEEAAVWELGDQPDTQKAAVSQEAVGTAASSLLHRSESRNGERLLSASPNGRFIVVTQHSLPDDDAAAPDETIDVVAKESQPLTLRLIDLNERDAAPHLIELSHAMLATDSVAFSRDSQQLAIAVPGGMIRRFTTETGSELKSFRVPSDKSQRLRFGIHDRWLIAGEIGLESYGLWACDLQDISNDPLPVIQPRQESEVGRYREWSVTADGHWLVVGAFDVELIAFELSAENRESVARSIPLGRSDEVFMPVVSSHDGQQLAAVSGKTCHVWDMSSKHPIIDRRILRGHDQELLACELSPDGRWLVTLEDPGRNSMQLHPRLWDLQASENNLLVQTLRAHRKPIWQAAEAVPMKRSFCTAGHYGQTVCWRPTQHGSWQAEVLTEDPDETSAFAVDASSTIAAIGLRSGEVQIWELRDDDSKLVQTIQNHSTEIVDLTFSNRLRLLAIADNSGSVSLWHRTTDVQRASGNSVDALQGKDRPPYAIWRPFRFAVEQDGPHLWFDHRDAFLFIGVDSQIQPFALKREAGTWQIQAYQGVVYPGYSGIPGYFGAWSQGSDSFLTAYGRQALLWRIAGDGIQGPLAQFQRDQFATRLAVSPNGQWLALGGWGSGIQLIDTRNLNGPPTILEAHDGDVTTVSFSDDSRWLASGGLDNRVMLWDLNQSNPAEHVLRFTGHRSNVRGVTFLPDRPELVTVSEDATVRLWRYELETVADQVQEFVGRTLTTQERARFELEESQEN